jgi:hypothetical protein
VRPTVVGRDASRTLIEAARATDPMATIGRVDAATLSLAEPHAISPLRSCDVRRPLGAPDTLDTWRSFSNRAREQPPIRRSRPYNSLRLRGSRRTFLQRGESLDERGSARHESIKE